MDRASLELQAQTLSRSEYVGRMALKEEKLNTGKNKSELRVKKKISFSIIRVLEIDKIRISTKSSKI
jgi:hypothetical protein